MDGLIVALCESAELAETVSGLIMSGASVLGYLIAEGLADSANAEVIVTEEEQNKIGY